MIDLSLLKKRKKELNLSYDDIAELSNIPRRTVISIFSGTTKTPRIDTAEAIEKALGVERTAVEPKISVVVKTNNLDLSNEEKALIITLRHYKKDNGYIRAIITMIGETASVDEILKRA